MVTRYSEGYGTEVTLTQEPSFRFLEIDARGERATNMVHYILAKAKKNDIIYIPVTNKPWRPEDCSRKPCYYPIYLFF